MAKAARKPYHRMATYISKSFAYNTSGIGTAATVEIGALPAGCLPLEAYVRVKTAFNAATTNVIIVGTSADTDAIFESGDIDESSTGTTVSDRYLGTVLTADTSIYVQYTQSGTAATAGEADVVITYIPEVES